MGLLGFLLIYTGGGGGGIDKLFVHFQTVKSIANNLCKTF